MNAPQSPEQPEPQLWERPPYPVLISRALKLKCPRCGQGKLFRGLFSMPERCSQCALKYERAPGYYLGSSYFNYGMTAVLLIITYVIMRNGFGLTNKELAPWMSLFCALFPLFFFRYARALWLAMDCRWDPAMMSNEED